jgi:L-asparagine permease
MFELVFLLGVLVLMALDPPIGTWTMASLVLIIPALVVGWFAVRSRALAVAQEREGFTGQFPVVANRPPPRDKDE